MDSMRFTTRRIRRAAACALLTVPALGVGGTVAAAEEPPAFSVVFPAGDACAGFALRIDGFGDGPEVVRERIDRDGDVVRTLSAGTGYAFRYTNVTTRGSFTSRADGSVSQTSDGPNGSQTQILTGHNVVILFPSDDPPGPSTTLHVGRVVVDIDRDGVYTVRQESGRAIDVCAAVSD